MLRSLTDLILGDNPDDPSKRPIRLVQESMKFDDMLERLRCVAANRKNPGEDPEWDALMTEILEYVEAMRGGMETFFQAHPNIAKYEKSI